MPVSLSGNGTNKTNQCQSLHRPNITQSNRNFLQKGPKIVFFAQKTPDFGPKNRLRIWGVPPSPPLRIFFQQKGGYRFRGYPRPPLYGQIRKVVFEVFPNRVC